MKRQLLFPLIATGFLGPLSLAHATDALMNALESQIEANRASAAAQKSVDDLSEQSRRMLEEYRDALRRTEALDAYNAHLRRLVASQEEQKRSLEKQLDDMELTRREVVPLMLRMVDALERFVALDRPFLSEERTGRAAGLKKLMNRPDVGDAEKFRRLLEVYKSENEYGKTMEAYRGELEDHGAARTVDFLRVGRVALLYRSLDGREAGVWSQRTRSWQSLPPDYAQSLQEGLAIARHEAAPQLLPIAADAPEVVR